MSCACENRNLGRDFDRFWKLAKAFAKMQGETTVIYKNDDGTYGFAPASSEIDKPIVEYVTPY